MQMDLRVFLDDLQERLPHDFVRIERTVAPHQFEVTALLQHLEVLNDPRERHVQRLREVADRCRPPAQPLDDRPARGVRERVEDPVDGGLVKH